MVHFPIIYTWSASKFIFHDNVYEKLLDVNF